MLTLHILAALITLSSCVYVWYKPSFSLQKILRISTLLSLLSGGYVAFNQNLINRETCVKLGVYLFMIAIAEYRLYRTLGSTASVPYNR